MGDAEGTSGGGIARSDGEWKSTLEAFFLDVIKAAVSKVVRENAPEYLSIPLNVGAGYAVDSLGQKKPAYEKIGSLVVGNDEVVKGSGVRFLETSPLSETYGLSAHISIVNVDMVTTFNVYDQARIVIEMSERCMRPPFYGPPFACDFGDGAAFQVTSRTPVSVYRKSVPP